MPVYRAEQQQQPASGLETTGLPQVPVSPECLQLLLMIADGEAKAQQLLEAWAQVTADGALAALLQLVALRSAEQAAAFKRRALELGAALPGAQPPTLEFQRLLQLARSPGRDQEKFEQLLAIQDSQAPDSLPNLFAHAMDTETGALLGRYMAVERDNDQRLRQAYRRLAPNATPSTLPADSLREIFTQLDQLTRTIEELKAITAASNTGNTGASAITSANPEPR